MLINGANLPRTEMGINWDNSPLFGGEYYSDTPFMLSPISPGSPNVSYTMPQRYGF
eukprot:COSAG01_NODE_76250_length_188_cov_26.011236_1_plen_55_part_01